MPSINADNWRLNARKDWDDWRRSRMNRLMDWELDHSGGHRRCMMATIPSLLLRRLLLLMMMAQGGPMWPLAQPPSPQRKEDPLAAANTLLLRGSARRRPQKRQPRAVCVRLSLGSLCSPSKVVPANFVGAFGRAHTPQNKKRTPKFQSAS